MFFMHSISFGGKKSWASLLAGATFIFLYFQHFIKIWKYAVDVPFYDEWEMLNEGAISSGSFQWLFAKHNEHLILPTKLMSWLLFQIDGWNIRTQILLNFGIFGLLAGSIVILGLALRLTIPLWVQFSFSAFLLSTLPGENHLWAFQSQFHFFLLFKILGIFCLFRAEQKWSQVGAGGCLIALAIFSFSAGVASAMAAIFGFALFKSFRMSRGWRRELGQLILVGFIVGAALLFWLSTEHFGGNYAYPSGLDFWMFFFRIVGWGFSIISISPLPGYLAFFLLVVVPVILILWTGTRNFTNRECIIFVCIATTLSELAAIAFGRANLDGGLMISRYAEVAYLLVPWSAFAWALALEKMPRLRIGILSVIWIFFAFTSRDQWSETLYRETSEWRHRSLECLWHENADSCNLYPDSIALRVENARKWNVSFTRSEKFQ